MLNAIGTLLDEGTFVQIGGPGFNASPQFAHAPQNSNQRAINDAVADALAILSTNNPCSEFFGGFNPQNGSRDGTAVLTALGSLLTPGILLNRSTGIQQSDFGTVVNTRTGLEYRMPSANHAVVNTNGAFFLWEASVASERLLALVVLWQSCTKWLI